ASCCMPLVVFVVAPHPTPTLFPYTTLFRSAASRTQTAGRNPGVRFPPDLERRHPTGKPSAWAVPRDDGQPRSRPSGRCGRTRTRSEEHTSELQSLAYLVCRLLLEKKKQRAG